MGGSDIGEGGPRGIGLTASDRGGGGAGGLRTSDIGKGGPVMRHEGGGGAGAIDRRTIGSLAIGRDVGPATCSGGEAGAVGQSSLRLRSVSGCDRSQTVIGLRP